MPLAARPTYEIRAVHDAARVRVYQAFRRAIAEAALAAQTFVPPFAMGRMTWIKPSFNWMRDRCGDASKPDQERVLAIELDRAGFDWALEHAVLSVHAPALHGPHDAWRRQLTGSCVRVQWDPDRDDALRPTPARRAIQIGLRDEAVRRYVEDWIKGIADVTAATRLPAERAAMVAAERPYPMPAGAVARLVPRGT